MFVRVIVGLLSASGLLARGLMAVADQDLRCVNAITAIEGERYGSCPGARWCDRQRSLLGWDKGGAIVGQSGLVGEVVLSFS